MTNAELLKLKELIEGWKGFEKPKDEFIMSASDCAEDLECLLETFHIGE